MGYKTIKRDEGGNWQHVDADLGPGKSLGKNEVNKRHELRQRELEDAIAKDSSLGTGEGDRQTPENEHPVLKTAMERTRFERDPKGMTDKRYNRQHPNDPSADGVAGTEQAESGIEVPKKAR